MKRIFVFSLFLLFFSCVSIAQNTKEEKQLEEWFDAQKYDKVIAHKAPKNTPMSDFYYRLKALAFVEKDDIKNALTQIDLAIKAKPISYKNYHAKAYIQLQQNELTDAIKTLTQGIEQDSMAYILWEMKGLLHQEGDNMKEAQKCYQKSIMLEPDRPESRIYFVQSLIAQDSFDVALEMITEMENSDKWGKDEKKELLAQKVTIFLRKKDNEKAQEILNLLHKENPNDAETLARLMQVCNAQNKLEEALAWREKLYKVYNAKTLQTEDKYFVFERFDWNDYRVAVIEFYNQAEDKHLEIKHKFIFYKDGKAEFRVQSESSYAVRMAKKEYVLCKVDEAGYHTFWDFTFDKDPKYTSLKEAVLKIAEGNVKPSAETIIKQ